MSQRTAKLVRYARKGNSLLGKWKSDNNFTSYTIENDKLSIPVGTYNLYWRFSTKHSCNLYGFKNVSNRNDIEIHSANLAEQLLGCIAPGDGIAYFTQNSIRPGVPIETIVGVTNSVATLFALEKSMRDYAGKQESFKLEITEEIKNV